MLFLTNWYQISYSLDKDELLHFLLMTRVGLYKRDFIRSISDIKCDHAITHNSNVLSAIDIINHPTFEYHKVQ